MPCPKLAMYLNFPNFFTMFMVKSFTSSCNNRKLSALKYMLNILKNKTDWSQKSNSMQANPWEILNKSINKVIIV